MKIRTPLNSKHLNFRIFRGNCSCENSHTNTFRSAFFFASFTIISVNESFSFRIQWSWSRTSVHAMLQVNLLPLLQRIQLPCVQWAITAKLREAFLFQVPNSFGIFLISFAILKNPFANPLKKVANLLMEFANCNVPKLIKCF